MPDMGFTNSDKEQQITATEDARTLQYLLISLYLCEVNHTKLSQFQHILPHNIRTLLSIS